MARRNHHGRNDRDAHGRRRRAVTNHPQTGWYEVPTAPALYAPAPQMLYAPTAPAYSASAAPAFYGHPTNVHNGMVYSTIPAGAPGWVEPTIYTPGGTQYVQQPLPPTSGYWPTPSTGPVVNQPYQYDYNQYHQDPWAVQQHHQTGQYPSTHPYQVAQYPSTVTHHAQYQSTVRHGPGHHVSTQAEQLVAAVVSPSGASAVAMTTRSATNSTHPNPAAITC